jgi:hypothetical protein
MDLCFRIADASESPDAAVTRLQFLPDIIDVPITSANVSNLLLRLAF